MPRRLTAICRSVISLLLRSRGLLTTLMMRAVRAASLPITLLICGMPTSGSSAASRTFSATSGSVGNTSSSFSMAWISSCWTFSASLLMSDSLRDSKRHRGIWSALDFLVGSQLVGQIEQGQRRAIAAAQVNATVGPGNLLQDPAERVGLAGSPRHHHATHAGTL